MKICVFGSSSDKLDKIYYDKAYELGEYLGELGHGIIFGGGSQGLMGAIARGVKSKNGYIKGVAPTFFNIPGILYLDCTEMNLTRDMPERKDIMESEADCFITLPGGIGTFEEVFEVMTLKQLGQLNKPIAFYNINNYYDELIASIKKAENENFMSSSSFKIFDIFDDKEEMLKYIENEIKNPMDTRHLKNI